jgi:TRAP-type C4-dicarboxylate transport system permease small subunit
MKKVFRIIEKLCGIEGWICMALIALSLLYLVAYVVFRMFKITFSGSNEIIELAMCLLCFSAYAYTQVKRKHIQIGMILNKLPIKIRYIISAFHCCWSTALAGFLTYACYVHGMNAVKANKLSTVLKIPYGPVYYICAVLMLLFTITFLCDVIKSIMAVCGNQEMQEDISKGWV